MQRLVECIVLMLSLTCTLVGCTSSSTESSVNSTIGRQIDPKALKALIETADRLVVTVAPTEEWEPARRSSPLYTTDNKADIEALAEALEVENPKKGVRCGCVGSPAIYLYKGENEIAVITNHHGKSIRYRPWWSDAPIADTEKWLTWFDQRGISGPRREFMENWMRQEENKKERNIKQELKQAVTETLP